MPSVDPNRNNMVGTPAEGTQEPPILESGTFNNYVNRFKTVDADVIEESILTPGVALSCSNLYYRVRQKTLLKSVRFIAEPGELVIITGLSGSGKTTLLECITGRAKPDCVSGEILLQGRRVGRSVLQEACNYVMAHGRLLPYLTVEETLMTAANLTLPAFTVTQRKNRVDEVIQELGLEKCRKTFIGGEWKKGISTGEQRRVNIGIKLLSNPPILVFDEPASGLDSALACELLLLLKRLAASGRTVICSLHQPTSQMWEKLDTVVILSHGHVIYHGKASNLRDYYSRLGYSCPESYSPVDFVLNLVAPINVNQYRNNAPFDSSHRSKAEAHSHDNAVSNIPSNYCYAPPSPMSFEPSSYFSSHGILGRLCRLISCRTSKQELKNADTPAQPSSTTSSLPDSVWAAAEQGLPVYPAQPGTVAVSSLASAFEESKEAAAVRQRISATTISPRLTLSQHTYKLSRRHKLRDTSVSDGNTETVSDEFPIVGSSYFKESFLCAFGRETRALCIRSFKNAIRNPVVCSVILLVQLLQGLILGGMFWNLTSGVNQQTPWHVDTVAIVNNPWTQLFIHGLDGQQPLLDALEMGVDGDKSQPLLNLFNNPEPLSVVHMLITCASLDQKFISKYPSFNLTAASDWRSKERLNRAAAPREILHSAILGSQSLDFLRSVSPQTTDATTWWGNMGVTLHQEFMRPYVECLNILRPDLMPFTHPPTPSTTATGNSASRRPHRMLLPMGDLDPYTVVRTLVGSGAPRLIYSIRYYLENMGNCEHRVCRSVKQQLELVANGWSDFWVATAAMLNVCGALFFVVANLGFSSYDALLTFPQERTLFNRETASGLYKPLSYFVAKNCADIPFQLLPSFLLVTVFYLMAHLGHTFEQYLLYCVSCAGVTFAAYGFGYFVSAACPRMEVAILVAPATLVLWLTVSGFFLRDELIPSWIAWFSRFSFYKWGFFSLVLNQFPPPPAKPFGVFSNAIPRLVAGVTETRIAVTLLALFGLGFLYRFAAFLALVYTNRTIGLHK